ncbi:MAG: esterase-like activity of phytase family protein, partial [bacterium]
MIIKITPIQLFILAVIFMLTACSNAQESNQNAGGEQSRTSGHTTLNREARWSPRSTKFTNMELLGEVTFKTGFTYQGVELGGLSGITYDAVNNLYYAISDDPGNKAPARFYTLKIALNDGTLDEGDVTFMALTTLYDKNHQPFPKDSIDPESLVLTKSRTLFISSEGNANYKIDPFIRQFSLDGSYLSSLSIPLKFLPTAGPDIGIRNNLAFESLTLTPDEAYLFTGIENAINQDGPKTSINTASPSRLLKYNLATGERVSEFLYWVEPVVAQPIPSDGFNVNGLVELIALDEYTLISLERSYSVGVGNAIKLYQTSLMNADDISSFDRLDTVDLSTIHAAEKSLLFDLSKFGIPLDNIEGMTFGPKLVDGRQILILVSDNNFNPLRQFTQFIAMAMNTPASLPPPETVTTIHEIQGAAHSSPLSGRHVKNVLGIVTAVQKSGRNRGFWMQTPHADDNAATSEGIFVLVGKELGQVEVGDAIQVSGTVAEYGFPGELTTTRLVNPEVQVLSHGNELPAARVIGFGGKIPPTQVIDDDSLQTFDPESDGIDFYESLEGMRVQVNDGVVVGPTSNYGEIVILADRGRNASVRTPRGGIVVRPLDFNPERILVDDRLVSGPPNVNVGDRFAGAIVGIVDYSFGNFKLLNTQPLPGVISAGLTP